VGVRRVGGRCGIAVLGKAGATHATLAFATVERWSLCEVGGLTCHTKGKFLTFKIASAIATIRHVPPGAERRVYLAKEARTEGTRPAAMTRPAARILVITGRRRAADILLW